ncbi:hypothetical protein F4778DRAFT_799407 [Xylariomycetidae sp. FL2044]|nr:hypothetical protein F4778DRAFT_799407 [Xylariomycetidae sp. FL2044]
MTTRHEPRFLIAIDYGTTYTGVAWVLTTGSQPRLSDIHVVSNWPDSIDPKVPSLYTYTASDGQRWGANIGENAYVIRWTKLELEKPSLEAALNTFRRTLLQVKHLNFRSEDVRDNRIPHHITKTPREVMTSYLKEVAEFVRRDIEANKDPESLKDFPWVEQPFPFLSVEESVWDTRAKNHTFRATTEAFNDVFPETEVRQPLHGPPLSRTYRLATESEACAQYTMKIAREEGLDRLRKCFIVVDAGGGTVDLVSYIVDEVAPLFQVTKVTELSSGRYGSTIIDQAFLYDFLPSRLSTADYEKLMNESRPGQEYGRGTHILYRGGEQQVLQNFLTAKHGYKGDKTSIPDSIELPEGIGEQDNPEKKIMGGQLLITASDMEEMFKKSVEGTLTLIQQQITQVDAKGYEVKAIFFSGGLSRSEYIRKEINKLARRYHIKLHCGEESWTAVVTGAALMGLGVGCKVPPANIRCPYHVGVVVSKRFTKWDHDEAQKYTDTFDGVQRARGNIHWLVTKGDLITQDEGINAEVKLTKKITLKGNRTGTVTIVTSTSDLGQNPNHDPLRREHRLDYDLNGIPPDSINSFLKRDPEWSASVGSYYEVGLQLEISINQKQTMVTLVCGKTKGLYGDVGAQGQYLGNFFIPFPT